MLICSPTQNNDVTLAEDVYSRSYTILNSPGYVPKERQLLVVTVLFSSRSCTQTAPLSTLHVDCLPCLQSPDRKPPGQPDSAMTADNQEKSKRSGHSKCGCIYAHTGSEHGQHFFYICFEKFILPHRN